MGETMRKPPLECLNFARAMMTLQIVFYHSCCFISGVIGPGYFERVAVSSLGTVTVFSFFALSGLVIKRNNSETKAWKFYKKRFLSIYPSFWIAWAVVYLLRVVGSGSFFYNGNRWSIILSFLGMDGYMGGAYYCAGEWFLGAIIITYICAHPLLWLQKHASAVTSAALVVIYYNVICRDCFGVSSFRNIIICIVGFWAGLLLADGIEKIVDSGVLFIVLLWTIWHVSSANSPFTVYTNVVIQGISMFLVLSMIGRLIKNPLLIKGYSFISKISFQIFLVHSVFLSNYARWMGIKYLQAPVGIVFYEVSSLLIICALAYGLYILDRAIKRGLLHGRRKEPKEAV